MSAVVLVCGNALDGISDALTGPAEILVEGNRIEDRAVGGTAARCTGDRSLRADGRG